MCRFCNLLFFVHTWGCKRTEWHFVAFRDVNWLFTDYVGPFLLPCYWRRNAHCKRGGAFSQLPYMRTLGWVCHSHNPSFICPQASSLPMSIIIVGVGPAEFDGEYGNLQSFSIRSLKSEWYDDALFTIDRIDLHSVIKGAGSASYNILSLFFLPFQNIYLCEPVALSSLWLRGEGCDYWTPVSVIVSSPWTQWWSRIHHMTRWHNPILTLMSTHFF